MANTEISSQEMNQSTDIPLLFSDEALLVVNKPAGLSTLPDGYNPSLPHIKSVLERQFGHLWIVHRLDKDTSGVLLLARSAEAHRALNTQFEQHRVPSVTMRWWWGTLSGRSRPSACHCGPMVTVSTAQ